MPVSGDRKRYQLIATMLERHPKLLEYLFNPTKPELSAPADELLKNPFSGGEKILIKAGIAFWNEGAHLELMELQRLDSDAELRVLKAYLALRSL